MSVYILDISLGMWPPMYPLLEIATANCIQRFVMLTDFFSCYQAHELAVFYK